MKSLLHLIQPKSKSEDDKRIEFIFNILIVSIIVLILCATLTSLLAFVFASSHAGHPYDSVSSIVMIGELSFFLLLYILSRKGFLRFASYLFVGVLFLLAMYMGYQWGVDLPFFILACALVITIAGVLIRARFAFLTAGIVALMMLVIGRLQATGVIQVISYWRHEQWRETDTAIAAVIFMIIAIVSWLSNREIARSLDRARKSEAELKAEKDLLEVKVEERTRELKQVQVEKMSQVYRFAEFGRLSSGIFHDLINLLTPVSLNIERLKRENTEGSDHTVSSIEKAVSATRKMEGLVSAVRGQLARKKSIVMFSVREEISQIADILKYKALTAGVKIICRDTAECYLWGDPLKFNQIILNLVANGIDAYSGSRLDEKSVFIITRKLQDMIQISISDQGAGIPLELKEKIFEPFFTTKTEGIGIGLSMTKHIVEKDFGGTLRVESELDTGSTFILLFPLRLHNENNKKIE